MNKIKVLMIDDNVQLIEAVKEYFKSSKLIEIVDEAYDGLDGFKKIETSIYDVVILDLIMPKKDGLYVLEQMKKNNIMPKRVQFIYPATNKEANIMLIEGIKNGNEGMKIMPPLFSHNDNGDYTEEIKQFFEKR